MDLFVPDNLDLHKDGSVTPHDFGKKIVPNDNESFSDFYKRYEREMAKLKSYERGRWIPYEQERLLYKVQIFCIPTKLTQQEEDEQLAPRLMYEKWFLHRENAIRFAKNKIKQQSIGYYYSKDNPHRRQYAFFYIIIHKGEMETAKAINGKII